MMEKLGFEIYNLGCDNPVELEHVVELLEKGHSERLLSK